MESPDSVSRASNADLRTAQRSGDGSFDGAMRFRDSRCEMRSSRLIAAAGGWALFVACGGAVPGDPCNTGGYLCDNGNAALECRDGRWRSLPCRGPGGCKETSDSIDCDMTLNLVDDPCAESSEGFSICASSGSAVLECRTGRFQQTRACSSCSATGATLTCLPP
jgi:hypothetical protein